MKKYFLITIGTLLALPLMNSCGGDISGDPKKDAEDFKSFYEKRAEIDFEEEQKQLEILEYYAEKKNEEAYNDFIDYLEYVKTDAKNEYEKKYRDKTIEMKKARNVAEAKLFNKPKNTTNDNATTEPIENESSASTN